AHAAQRSAAARGHRLDHVLREPRGPAAMGSRESMGRPARHRAVRERRGDCGVATLRTAIRSVLFPAQSALPRRRRARPARAAHLDQPPARNAEGRDPAPSERAVVTTGWRRGLEGAIANAYAFAYDAVVEGFAPYEALRDEVVEYVQRSAPPGARVVDV